MNLKKEGYDRMEEEQTTLDLVKFKSLDTKELTFDLAKDPLTRFLHRKLGWWEFIPLCIILPLIVVYFSMLEGCFFEFQAPIESVKTYPLYNDFLLFLIPYILVAIGIPLARNVMDSTSYWFNRLWNRRVFNSEVSLKKYLCFIKKYEKKACEKKMYILGFVFSLIVILNLFIMTKISQLLVISEPGIGWTSFDFFPLTSLSLFIGWYFYAFLTGSAVWKGYVLVKCMREVCNKNNFVDPSSKLKTHLQLQPLNPDNSAGLQPLGKLSFNISMCLILGSAAPIMLFYFFFFRARDFPYWGIFVLQTLLIWIFTSLFLFFYSLMSAHTVMKDTKAKMLDRLSAKLGFTYRDIFESITHAGERVEKEKIDRLISIRMLYIEAGKMPVWPFDTHTLLRFIITIIIPIIIFVLQAIISWWITPKTI